MVRGSLSYVGLTGLTALASCTAGETGGDSLSTMVDSAGVVVITSDLSSLAQSCSLGKAPRLTIGDRSDDEGHQLYRVFGATKLDDGRVALVNQGTQELRFYSPEGEFLSAFGREGEGPGEFRNAFHLWRMPGDTLLVGDYRPWEFEVFAPDGQWIRAIRPRPLYGNSPRAIAIMPDGRTVLGSIDLAERRPDFQLQHLHLALHDAEGALVDTVAVLPNGRWGLVSEERGSPWLYPWFESFAEVTARGDRLVLGHGSAAELRLARPSSAARPDTVIRWIGLDRSVTGADVDAAVKSVEDQYRDLDEGMRQRFVGPLVHEDRPVASRMPAFTNVRVGTDQSIWIRLHRAPESPAGSDWIRFGPDGRAVCRLAIPGEMQVYEFGADYVLGEEPGPLEEEIVTLYDLSATDHAF